MLMPRVPGPRAFINSWPLYAHDWADMLAQQEADEADKLRNQREANRTRLQPSSVEIMHMEQAISWPARYLREFPQLIRAVQAVAAEARGLSVASFAATLIHTIARERLFRAVLDDDR
jgi:hypothetical protein